MAGDATVLHIFAAPNRGAAMQSLQSVEALEGVGLRGDRYATIANRHTPNYQVTLIESEHLEAFTRSSGLELSPDQPRRNIVTRGVRLDDLCGKRFRIGAVLLEGAELCEPCSLFAKRTHREVLTLLAGKGGLRARVVSGGEIRVGDSIFQERSAPMQSFEFRNRDGLRLAADYYPAESDAVMVMANDFFTHRRWRGRYPFIAGKLNERGIAALAFDYAGCGASDDATLHPDSMAGDLRCAVEAMRGLGHGRPALWGHGLASSLCIEACVPEVRAMVLSACGTAAISYDWSTELGPESYARLMAEGTVSVPSYDARMRPQQTIHRSLLENLGAIDQEALLGKLSCPVLLINGADPANVKERERLEANRRGAHLLPRGSAIRVIEGAGHSFAGHLEALAECAIEWLGVHLPRHP